MLQNQLLRHNRPPRFAVGGVLYRYRANGQLEFVLIKKRGGHWTLPKGHLEGDETMGEALVREMAEEVALYGVPETILSTVGYAIKKHYRHYPKLVRYYLVRVMHGKPRPNQNEKIYRARWFAMPQGLQRVQSERVQEIIEQAIHYLQY